MELNHEELRIAVEERGEELHVRWTGRCDQAYPGAFLNPFFHRLLQRVEGRRVVLDFRDLRFLNSASIVPLVSFLANLVAEQVDTEVLLLAGSNWQGTVFRGLAGLERLAPVQFKSQEAGA